ncbi:MAG: hypothetical protein WD402_10020 [Chloroflexota bacterium]
MTDHNDEFERSLTERLRASEARVPGAAAPDLATIGSRSTRARALAWGALVAGGGVATGLIVVLLLNDRPAPPTGEATATPHPTSSASETATQSPSVTTSPAPSGQEQLSVIPIAGLGSEDEVRAIIEVDGRLIGVGRHGDQGAVWTSLDGGSWTLAPDLPATEPLDYAATTMTSIVQGPGGLVAVGTWQTIDVSTPRIWYSTDGQRWTSVYGPSGFERIEALAVGGPGYVAIGLASDDGFTGRPQVWTSADGRDWTSMDSVGVTGSLNDVIGEAGMMVAVGGSGSAASSFVSTDGATWTAAPEQGALQGAEMTSVAFRDGAFVATGALTGPGDTYPATPAIWHSRDGLNWSLVLQGESGQRVSQAVSSDEGFVAIGGHFPSAGWSYDPAGQIPPSDTIQLWFSADGETWSGPTTGFLADGGINTLGQAIIMGGDLFVPVTLLSAGPDGPVYQPAILRGPLPL